MVLSPALAPLGRGALVAVAPALGPVARVALVAASPPVLALSLQLPGSRGLSERPLRSEAMLVPLLPSF